MTTTVDTLAERRKKWMRFWREWKGVNADAPRGEDRYKKKLATLRAAGLVNGHRIDHYHDSTCNVFKKRECTCDAMIDLEPILRRRRN